MAWYDTKQAAVDPDNPTADEQFPYSEHNAMVAYLKDKLIGKAIDQTAIANDKILVYKSATDNFVFEAQAAAAAIGNLTDVVISGVPANNEVLAFDFASLKWINQTAAEAGLALVADVVLESDFNATTFLYATADNTPEPKNVAETLAILSVESGADVTDATNVNAAGAVMEADFNATTFLYATADNTPLPKTPAETLAILSGSAAAEFLFNTQNIGGIVDPTTAQQAATKNYADIHLFTKGIVTTFTDGFIPVYRTSSGKFEMEEAGGSAGLPVADTNTIVKGSADGTKLMRFEVDGLTTGVTRIMTVPDKNITLCDTAEAMLLSGTQAMAGDLDMGDNDIIAAKSIQGYSDSEYMYYRGGISSYSPALYLYGRDHATLAGHFKFLSPDAAGTNLLTAMEIHGKSDTPLIEIGYGLDMNAKDIDDIGGLILNDATELTIATGAVSITQSYHTIDTEGDIASDDLTTIGGSVSAGQILVVKAANGARTVVAKDGTGNLKLEGDMSLDNAEDTLTMISDGTFWYEISRANNGA